MVRLPQGNSTEALSVLCLFSYVRWLNMEAPRQGVEAFTHVFFFSSSLYGAVVTACGTQRSMTGLLQHCSKKGTGF